MRCLRSPSIGRASGTFRFSWDELKHTAVWRSIFASSSLLRDVNASPPDFHGLSAQSGLSGAVSKRLQKGRYITVI